MLAAQCIGCRSDVAQQDAIALARSKGADIRISVKGDAQRVDLRRCQIDNDLRAALKQMPVIETLIVGTSFSNAEVGVFDSVASVKNLDLSHSKVSAETLGRLLDLRGLVFLSLNGLELTDADMEVVAKLRQLKSISFVDAKVSDTAMDSFRKHNPDCVIAR